VIAGLSLVCYASPRLIAAEPDGRLGHIEPDVISIQPVVSKRAPTPRILRQSAGERYSITRVAETGDEPPGRIGAEFETLENPNINALGDVVFKARYTGVSSGNEGVYRFRNGALERIIDDGFNFHPPGQGGATSYTGFAQPVTNSRAEVGFQGGFSFGDGNQGLYLVDASQVLLQFENNPFSPVPGQPPTSQWTTFPFTAGIVSFLTESGHSATIARYRDAGFVEYEGVYLADASPGVIRVADEHSPVPGQSAAAAFSTFDPFMVMNNEGDLAFSGQYSAGVGSRGIYLYDKNSGTLRRVADASLAPPDQPLGARFSAFDIFPSMNDSGVLVFGATYTGGSGTRGIFAGDGLSPSRTIVDNSGAFSVPGHPTRSFSLFGPPIVDPSGGIVFVGEFGPGPRDVGVFRAGPDEIRLLFDLSTPVPDQPGAAFTQVGNIAANANEQLTAAIRYTGGTGNEGVYVYDGSELIRVIDESQDLFGRAPANFDMMLGTGGSGGRDGKATSLNDAGQVVFGATFADGSRGVYLASPNGSDCTIDDGVQTVTIGMPGNDPDTNGNGSVPRAFRMGVYEVTNTEFVEFLNAIAADDVHAVYDEVMTTSLRGGILRSGTPGSYTYQVKPGFEAMPASGFSWSDGARFCNWLHNGKPIGLQSPATTENGAYDLSVALASIVRNPDARWFIPSRDEWYKAAYFDPFDDGADANATTDYWEYPTRSDQAPEQAHSDQSGVINNPGPNVANYERGVDWNGTDCSSPGETCGNVSAVGSAISVSPWGCFDMGGNINEWTDTPGRTIPTDPPLPTRLINGGDFSNPLALLGSNLDADLNMQVDAANIGMRVASIACDGPIPGCTPADLAEPYGVLNFFDVVAYLAAFNANDPDADIAQPSGVWNFFDIVEFLAVFNRGCPSP